MNVYEVEIENEAMGYRLVHHLRAIDETDAMERAEKHWNRKALGAVFRRKCKDWEVEEQKARDQEGKPAPVVQILAL